jgi:hypothetical protein
MSYVSLITLSYVIFNYVITCLPPRASVLPLSAYHCLPILACFSSPICFSLLQNLQYTHTTLIINSQLIHI